VGNVPLVPLRTDRLTLRALDPDDLEAVFSILSDEATIARGSWRQRSLASTGEWLRKRIIAEKARGLSMWGVETLETHELIGLCGFFPRPADTALELGYVIKACHQGKGYATEAVRAAVEAAVNGGHRVYATIRHLNSAPIIVAERAGLRSDGELSDGAALSPSIATRRRRQLSRRATKPTTWRRGRRPPRRSGSCMGPRLALAEYRNGEPIALHERLVDSRAEARSKDFRAPIGTGASS